MSNGDVDTPGHRMEERYNPEDASYPTVFICECGWKKVAPPFGSNWFRYLQAYHAAKAHLVDQV